MSPAPTPSPAAKAPETAPGGPKQSLDGRTRRLGAKAAIARYDEMLTGYPDLPPFKQRLLKTTAGVMVMLENLQRRIWREGEVRASDGEPKELLKRLIELNRVVASNLGFIFEGTGPEYEPQERLLVLKLGDRPPRLLDLNNLDLDALTNEELLALSNLPVDVEFKQGDQE